MSNPVLFKYRDIRPVNDIATTDGMLRVLVEIPNERQEDMWIRDANVGNICLYRDSRFPGKILEYTQGSQDDSVTTLYDEHRIFTTRQALKEARQELITEIGAVLMRLPSTIAVYDGGREREAALRELGTAQLHDVLAHFTASSVVAA